MPKITIVRPYEWTNQRKNINVYIDDEKVGSVGIDSTVHFEVSPGKHKVVLKNRLSNGSQPLEVDLSDNEDKTIRMSTFKYLWLISIVAGIAIYTINKFLISFSDFESITSLAVVFAVVLFFLLFFSSRYAIKLKEVEVGISEP